MRFLQYIICTISHVWGQRDFLPPYKNMEIKVKLQDFMKKYIVSQFKKRM